MVIDADRYLNIYMPVLGDASHIEIHAHPRNVATLGCRAAGRDFDRLAAFSKGYFKLDTVDDKAIFADLRMGLTPYYAFQFALTDANSPILPPEKLDGLRNDEGDLPWLLSKLAGKDMPRPAEAVSTIALADLRVALGAPAPAC